jgi:predicted nucleic acid-binding protein
LAVRYDTMEALEAMIRDTGLVSAAIPRPALFLAGKAFQRYRTVGGVRTGVLSDFFIGAHAVIADVAPITRDARRCRAYFPGIALIAPN